MTISIQTPNFKADRKLLEFISNKLQKLNRFNNHIVNATVYLKLNNGSTENKTAEIKLNLKDSQLYAEHTHGSFEGACELVIDALRSQLAKLKTRTVES